MEFVRSGVDALLLCGLPEKAAVRFLKADRPDIPVVLCVHSKPDGVDLDLLPKVGVVLVDDESIGRHIGEFFLGHGLGNFAFVAMNINYERLYGRARCAAFRDVVLSGEGGGKTFSAKMFGACKENGDVWDLSHEAIVSWVETLPLPCGVFANGDYSAAVFIDVCRNLGLDIPGQIEIVSVNNSCDICEGMGVTISSVQPNFDEYARQSIDMAFKIAASDGLAAEERTS